MVERRGGAGLLLEALASVRIGSDELGKHLDRDLAAELRVPRPVDLAHASRAQRREDLVGSETGPGRKAHEIWADCMLRPSSDRAGSVPLSDREASWSRGHGRSLPRPRPGSRPGGGDQDPVRFDGGGRSREALPGSRGLGAPAASRHRDVLRGGGGRRHRVSRNGVRRRRDAARPPPPGAAPVRPGALDRRGASRGAGTRPRRRRPAPRPQARERDGDERQSRKASRFRNRAPARGRRGPERGRHGGRADGARGRHRDDRVHVSRAAQGAAARRALGRLFVRRGSLRDARRARGVSGRIGRDADRGHSRRRNAQDRSVAGGGRGRRPGARPGSRTPSPLGGRASLGPARPRLRRDAGLTSGHARARRPAEPLEERGRRLDRQRLRGEPGRGPLEAAGNLARTARKGSRIRGSGPRRCRARTGPRMSMGALGSVSAHGSTPSRDGRLDGCRDRRRRVLGKAGRRSRRPLRVSRIGCPR